MNSRYNLRTRDGSRSNKTESRATNGDTFAHPSSQEIKEGGDMESMQMVVFVTLIVDLLAFTMILPLLPSLLDYYSQTDKVSVSTIE